MEAWATEDKSVHQRLQEVLRRPKREPGQLVLPQGIKVHMTPGGKRSVKDVFNLCHLANEFMILDIGLYTKVLFETIIFGTSKDSELNVKELDKNATVDTYNSLEVPIAEQDTDDIHSYQLQKLGTTGKKYWRAKGPR